MTSETTTTAESFLQLAREALEAGMYEVAEEAFRRASEFTESTE